MAYDISDCGGLASIGVVTSSVRHGSLPALLEREGLSHAAHAERRQAGSEGSCSGAGGHALPPGASEDRTLECRARASFVSLQKSTAGVWRREASGSTSPDLEPFGDGRLASGRSVREHDATGSEEALAPDRSGKLT